MADNESSVFKKVGEQVAQAGVEVSRLKTAASHSIEDAVTEAKRLVKRSRYATEDLIDDAAQRIKHAPLRSVGIGLAIGLGVGILSGWLLGRSRTEE